MIQGYDAVYLASTLGLDTLGVDIAETAVETANRLSSHEFLCRLSEFDLFHRYLAATAPSASVTFKLLDFFSFKVPDDEKFDLAYDYTCALLLLSSKSFDICLLDFLRQFLHPVGMNGVVK